MAIRIGVVVMVLAVMAVLFAPDAILAARGGKRHSNGGETVTLTASPNPTPAGSIYNVKGCGFRSDMTAELRIVHATYTEAWTVWMWNMNGTGCIDVNLRSAEAGTYTIQAYQNAQFLGATTLSVT